MPWHCSAQVALLWLVQVRSDSYTRLQSVWRRSDQKRSREISAGTCMLYNIIWLSTKCSHVAYGCLGEAGGLWGHLWLLFGVLQSSRK